MSENTVMKTNTGAGKSKTVPIRISTKLKYHLAPKYTESILQITSEAKLPDYLTQHLPNRRIESAIANSLQMNFHVLFYS